MLPSMPDPSRTPAERLRLLKEIERELRAGGDEARACAARGVARDELAKWRLLFGPREPKRIKPQSFDGESGFLAGDSDDGGD